MRRLLRRMRCWAGFHGEQAVVGSKHRCMACGGWSNHAALVRQIWRDFILMMAATAVLAWLASHGGCRGIAVPQAVARSLPEGCDPFEFEVDGWPVRCT